MPILPVAQLFVMEGEGWTDEAGLDLQLTRRPADRTGHRGQGPAKSRLQTAGVLAATIPTFDAAQLWLARMLRPIPPLTWIPFAIIWFGVSETAAAFIIAIGVFWINYFTSYGAVRSVDPGFHEVALAVEPAVLLMDEPFSALDAITRRHLQQELTGLRQRTEAAVVFVTHDIKEAVSLADRVMVLGGRAPASVEAVLAVDLPLADRRHHDGFRERVRTVEGLIHAAHGAPALASAHQRRAMG